MSKDTIYREDAIDAIECVTWYHQNQNKDMVEGANSDEHQAWYKSQDVYKALESIPSADRPQGEWIYTMNPLRLNDEWECNKCGYLSFAKVNYCGHCGCRMKGADDE